MMVKFTLRVCMCVHMCVNVHVCVGAPLILNESMDPEHISIQYEDL